MSKKLEILKKNKFGDPQYVESDNDEHGQVDWESLPIEGFWSVKNPSAELSESLTTKFGGVNRKYGDTRFVLSEKAALNIAKEGHGYGSAVVVSFKYEGYVYYLFVTDNKHYAQTCQGAAENGEDQTQCAIRELEEELRITASPHELEHVGYWSFSDTNELIDYTRSSSTTAFRLVLPFERVSHLFPNGLNSPMECVKVSDLALDLNEITFVIGVREDFLESAPESIEQIKIKKKNRHGEMEDAPCSFSGHHREFVSRLAGFPEKYQPSYLSTFGILIGTSLGVVN